MKAFLAGLATMTLVSGAAFAQTATESTTTTQESAPAIPAPAPGVLSTTHESHAQDAYGDTKDSKSTSYRDSSGVARDSQTTTTTASPPPPPPPVSTSTSTTTETTSEPR